MVLASAVLIAVGVDWERRAAEYARGRLHIN